MKTLAEDKESQKARRQMILDESRQYFESLAAQYPDDEDVSASITKYQMVLEEGKTTSATLGNTTETATAQLEHGKSAILANSMYDYSEKAIPP